MSEQVTLAAKARAGSGKSEARSLRREGRVPAVAYGTGLEPTALSVDARELYHALRTEAGANAIFRIDVEGTTHLALAREIQRHPVRREVLHVDFVTVNRDVKVHVDVPLVLEGEAPVSGDGAVVDQTLFALPVEVLPLEVPAQVSVDITGLTAVGDVIRVGDLALPEGATTTEDPERTVVTVSVPQVELPSEEPGTAEAEAAADMAEGATGEGAAAREDVDVESVEG